MGGPRLTRVRTACVLLALGLTLLFAFPTGSAQAATSSEYKLASLLNQVRADHGLSQFRVGRGLSNLAHWHSQDMARAQRLFHNERLPYRIRHWPWKDLAENVGRGPTVGEVVDGFMHSPSHRELIEDPDFWAIGVGVFYSRGYAYTTVIFYA
jgi:uncharacterized protein YkwD